jgi:transposase
LIDFLVRGCPVLPVSSKQQSPIRALGPSFSTPQVSRAAPDFGFIFRFVRPSNREIGMNVCYRVELSQAERAELTAMLNKGKRAARKLERAQILLAADAGCSDEEIARTIAVGGSTVYRIKRRFVEGNLERALSEEPRPGAERKLSGKEKALLVATACANRPKGRARWTLELLADTMVKRAPEPVRRDGAPALGRKRFQALAQGYVVYSPG